ncbi:DUF7373 family lipoprotein [Klenkia taihuensis]|uniref:DUF7373 domain-containing protein n=1 Tax=Klenkia taihuensis TaxID=1225127 RepID=A0A1I1KY97_9ACTN|nr:hypothetical protein [Klenkia taihuensis]GHE10177.1 hypothetical protein GCM10011381_18030 [Klenkia taihuensis]SFC62370.1 hypothetical protein SAMN05661030_1481 [Klenkia taihuensis]
MRPLAGLLVLALAPLAGCSAGVTGTATPAATGEVGTLPGDVDGLGGLVLTAVPSGRPQVPDDELDPPAGPKTLADVAGYAEDAEREEEVLTDYGYRWGWERFWGTDDDLTSVFVDQFDGTAGAASYADDLARNDTEFYGGNPDRDPDHLPDGCATLTVEDPAEDTRLTGPAAFAWCAHGPFTVSVAVVSTDTEDALAQVDDLVELQLDRLPRG